MAVINSLATLKTYWAAGGTHTIEAGTYVLDADVNCTSELHLEATGAVTIDGNNAYRLSIDSADFEIHGANAATKLLFTDGDDDSLQIRATSAGVTGTFEDCAFTHAGTGEGCGIIGALAGSIEVDFVRCFAEHNGQDGMGAYDTAVGAGFHVTMTYEDCEFAHHTSSDYADAVTAHAINQNIVMRNCIVSDCVNAVSITTSAGGSNPGPSIDIDGLVCTDVKRAVRTISTTAPSTVVVKNLEVSNPKAAGNIIDMAAGTLVVEKCRLYGSATAGWAINLRASTTSTAIRDTIIAHFTQTGLLGGGIATESAWSLVDSTIYDVGSYVYTTVTPSRVANNVFMHSLEATYCGWFSAGGDRYTLCAEKGHNFFYDSTTRHFYRAGDALTTGDVNGDPELVAPATNDFTITTESACFEAGLAAWATATDIVGTTRRTPPSCGAYEYAASGGGSSVVRAGVALSMGLGLGV